MRKYLCVLLLLTALAGFEVANMKATPPWITMLQPKGAVTYPAWVTNQTLGTLRNNFTGTVGETWTISDDLSGTSIHVVALGRWIVSGNNQSHTLTLSGSGGSLGSVTLNTVGQTAGQYAYAYFPTPVLIHFTNGDAYNIATSEVSGDDQWYDLNTTINCNSNIGVPDFVTVNGNSGNPGAIMYGPINFLYTQP